MTKNMKSPTAVVPHGPKGWCQIRSLALICNWPVTQSSAGVTHFHLIRDLLTGGGIEGVDMVDSTQAAKTYMIQAPAGVEQVVYSMLEGYSAERAAAMGAGSEPSGSCPPSELSYAGADTM